ncbi:MAG: hypothetical protein J6I96_06545 [Oscillospiraceae bacterium]|nr:hypothetical protein [Oscillospiraceae bacterium]
MDVFNITLRALHIFGGDKNGAVPYPDDIGTWESLSSDTRGILDDILLFLEKEISRSDTKEFVIDNLRESVFGLVVPEGYIMLTGGLDKAMRHAVLGGFLIPGCGDLRTAWHFARWQLLLISSTSWNRTGDVSISLTDINTLAAAALEKINALDEHKLPGSLYMDRLREIGKDMMESAMPFSFAMTNFNKNHLMLDLRKGYQSAETISTGTGSIPIAQIDLDKYDVMMYEKYPFEDIRLNVLDSETFTEQKVLEIKKLGTPEAVRDAKALKKNAPQMYPAGRVWCFIFTDQGNTFSYPLAPEAHHGLYSTGVSDFDLIYKSFRDAFGAANKYFGKLSTRPMNSRGEKKGFLGFFGR